MTAGRRMLFAITGTRLHIVGILCERRLKTKINCATKRNGFYTRYQILYCTVYRQMYIVQCTVYMYSTLIFECMRIPNNNNNIQFLTFRRDFLFPLNVEKWILIILNHIFLFVLYPVVGPSYVAVVYREQCGWCTQNPKTHDKHSMMMRCAAQ